jgi:hypothetical protein
MFKAMPDKVHSECHDCPICAGKGTVPSRLPFRMNLRPMRRPRRGDADPAPATTRQAQGEGAGLAGVGTAFCGKALLWPSHASVAFDLSRVQGAARGCAW